MTEKYRSLPFHIKLAGIVIRIEPLFDYIQEYCKEYITNEPERFVVRIEQEDISYERECSRKETIDIVHSDAYLETLAVYRKIAERMPRYSIFLFHGSVVAVDGIGYLFTAKSGTGKSTHTGLWRKSFGERAVMVNDDKPLLEVTENGVMAHGTPWNGKHRLSTNISVPLKSICMLKRAEENCIVKIMPEEMFAMLLQQTYRPVDKAAMQHTLNLLEKLKKNIEFYKLECNMEIEAALIAYKGMV